MYLKKSILIILIIYIILTTLGINSVVNALAVRKTGINEFPDSYKPYLNALAAAHPNWTFTALNTGLDWATSVHSESDWAHGRSLIQGKTGEWVCSTCGNQIHDGSDWVCASYKAVGYMMDPRNFLAEQNIFQFENLNYAQGTYSLEVIENILYGSFMHNTKIDLGTKLYSQVIMEAGEAAKINPYHIAARMRQEIGSTRSLSVTGTYPGKEGLYNYFNIGATGGDGAIGRGLDWANTGTTYGRPWTTPEKAIKGGAEWLQRQYIYYGQNTLYLQKFDVDDSDGDIYWYQYMQNVEAALNEGSMIYGAYANAGKLGNAINFIIPVFNNMPGAASPMPGTNGNSSSNEIVTETVYLNDWDVNIRLSAGTSSLTIGTAQYGNRFIRIEKGVNPVNGYKWDKVVLPNGTKGFIASTYLTKTNPGTGKEEQFNSRETMYLNKDAYVYNGPRI